MTSKQGVDHAPSGHRNQVFAESKLRRNQETAVRILSAADLHHVIGGIGGVPAEDDWTQRPQP